MNRKGDFTDGTEEGRFMGGNRTRNENRQHFPLKYSSVIFTVGFHKWEKKEHFKNT